MLKEGGNVLLLDEPTNDLDVETLGALEEAIENFAGCAVVISHDRFFLDRLATHILAFEGDSHVEWFEGNFEAYEEDKRPPPGRGSRPAAPDDLQETDAVGRWLAEPIFFATEADFRRWLEANHETAPELLVGFWKKGSGKPSIDWPQARDQALCFGWIDGVRKSLGDEAYTIRFTPRRKGSIWSKVNVERFDALKAAGLMTAGGRAGL